MKKSIRNKMTLLFIIIIVFQFLLTGVFIIYGVKTNLVDTYSNHQKQMTLALDWEFSNIKSNMENYTLNIVGGDKIQHFLKTANLRSDADYTQVLTNELRNELLYYTNYDSSIVSIYLVDNKNRIYGNNSVNQFKNYVNKMIPVSDKAGGSAVWDSSYSSSTVVQFRTINDNQKNFTQKIGAVFIVIKKDMFNDVFNIFKIDSNQKYEILSNDSHLNVGNKELNSLAVDGNRTMVSYEGIKYMYISIDSGNWKLITWIPATTIYNPFYNLVHLMIGGLLVILLISIIMTVYFSGMICKPIFQIKHAMGEVGRGVLGVTVPETGEDEIGDLAKAMNKMSRRIENLIIEAASNERKRRMLELRTLQYQINPHFLYNTLDSVNMFARESKDDFVAELVTSLSGFFRISLNHGQETIRIKDEFQLIIYYLNIQSVRFPGKFTWETDVQDDIKDLKILKFILQPLVENSINHGIRYIVDMGHIVIRAISEENEIVLSVKDNGKGMTPNELKDLKSKLNMVDSGDNPFKGGFGLWNVHQRLKLFYGDAYKFTIKSEWDEGTMITIRIPLDRNLSKRLDDKYERLL